MQGLDDCRFSRESCFPKVKRSHPMRSVFVVAVTSAGVMLPSLASAQIHGIDANADMSVRALHAHHGRTHSKPVASGKANKREVIVNAEAGAYTFRGFKSVAGDDCGTPTSLGICTVCLGKGETSAIIRSPVFSVESSQDVCVAGKAQRRR